MRALLSATAVVPLAVLVGAATAPAPQGALESAPPAASEDVTVVAPTPVLGTGVKRDKVPAAVQALSAATIRKRGEPDVLGALAAEGNGVNLDSASGNPHQPSLYYKGFAVSPLQGTSQGLAVYLDGVRFNQAFGDTVNWDLIPDDAISKLTLVGANPAFGLNALGGAINIGLKNGFTEQGAEASLSGGSFGQIDADASYGVATPTESVFVAASARHADGWRDLQTSDLQNLYADYGRRRDETEAHARLLLANSVLNGPGTSPVDLLAVAPEAQFTAPNLVANRFLQAALSGKTTLANGWEAQLQAYYSYFQQRVDNGNATGIAPCGDGAVLCDDQGGLVLGRNATPIAAFRDGGPYSQLDRQTTNTNAAGAIGQIASGEDLLGHANHLALGASVDGADTLFSANSAVGGLDTVTREFLGPGAVIDTAGNSVPVRVGIRSLAAGVFATDTFNLTSSVALTASARLNFAETDLRDQNGTDLTGNHAFTRLNPAIGITWQARPWLSLYAGYAETNRAPTPAELSCAGPQNACSLANFFVGDPDLRQVVARTVEAGARGHVPVLTRVRAEYDIGLFRTQVDDDIGFINAPTLGRAYFTNIGATLRQGLNARLALTAASWSAYVAYSYTEATYQDGFTEAAGSNPLADAVGDITVPRGAALPGVPRQILKFGGAVHPSASTTVGVDGVLQSGQYLFGDEANLTPKLPGFVVMTLYGNWQVSDRWQVFARIENLTDARYYTYGTFTPTTSVFLREAPLATNPRSYSPAAPIGGFAGIRFSY